MSDNFEHPVYDAGVIEFVTAANEFCAFIENTEGMELVDFLEKLRKFIPLIYLKGSLLPKVDSEIDENIENFVTENDWLFIRESIKKITAQYDDYSEEFEERLYETDEPSFGSISENIADIYTALKDFLVNYRNGVSEVMNEALWALNNDFDDYWGSACVKALRKIHDLLAGEIYEGGISDDSDKNMDISNSFVARRQREWRK